MNRRSTETLIKPYYPRIEALQKRIEAFERATAGRHLNHSVFARLLADCLSLVDALPMGIAPDKRKNIRQRIELIQNYVKTNRHELKSVHQQLHYLHGVLGSIKSTTENRDVDSFVSMWELANHLAESSDLESLLPVTMKWVCELFGAERGFILLLNAAGEFDIRVQYPKDEVADLDSDAWKYSQTIIQMVHDTNQAVVTTNALEDPRFEGVESILVKDLRSIISVPMYTRGKVIGILYIDSRTTKMIYNKDDVKELQMLASFVATCIANVTVYEELDQTVYERTQELQDALEYQQEANQRLQRLLDTLQAEPLDTTKVNKPNADIMLFLSYSSSDREFATQLFHTLRKLGYAVWIDIEELDTGENWADTIQEALLQSEMMIVVMSPTAMQSANVLQEWQYFMHELKKPILPVMWEDCKRHFQLFMLQYTDFRPAETEYTSSIKQLVNAIQNAHLLTQLTQ